MTGKYIFSKHSCPQWLDGLAGGEAIVWHSSSTKRWPGVETDDRYNYESDSHI